MINDENRREVAQKLRDAATECYNYGVLESDVLNILGVYATDSACLVSSDSVMDVADLIDRKTCRNVYTETARAAACENGFMCSECGNVIEDYEGYYVIGTFNYCSKCGAEVIE